MKLNRKQLRRMIVESYDGSMGPIGAPMPHSAFDQLENDIADLVSDAIAAGMSTKELAVAIESALSLAHSMQQGREMDFRVEITASPLPRRR